MTKAGPAWGAPGILRTLVVVISLMAVAPPAASAAAGLATATDCRVRCGLVLGMTSFTVATGSAVTWGRITGGIRTRSQGQSIWAISFATSLASAVTLSGARRERAVYAAGIGAAAGALLGLTVDTFAGGDQASTKVAAALMGAAVGAVAGGVYGAFSHEEEAGPGPALAARQIPLFGIRLSF